MTTTARPTDYIILGTLMSGPRHGYEILQFIRTELQAAWSVGTSQLYSAVKRLERDGLLCGSMEVQNARPPRRVFQLAPPGREAFLGWLHRPTTNVRNMRVEFLTKLYFFRSLACRGGSELVASQVAAMERLRDRMQARPAAPLQSYRQLLHSFKLATLEAHLLWLQSAARAFIDGEIDHE